MCFFSGFWFLSIKSLIDNYIVIIVKVNYVVNLVIILETQIAIKHKKMLLTQLSKIQKVSGRRQKILYQNAEFYNAL